MPQHPKLITVLTLCLICATGFGQDSFQAAFWNVENLFDTTHTIGVSDEDFTPSGRYHWDEEKLAEKCRDLAQVIHDLNRNGDLALLGLAEIENRNILLRLNSQSIKSGFELIHKESPDERGIDVALLYKPDILYLKKQTFIPVYLAGEEKTRDILEARFQIRGIDHPSNLIVFVNHWPSRYGGQAETEPLRFATARILRERIDEILRVDPKADILIMGDLNDYPDDPSIRKVLRALPPRTESYPGDLVNTSFPLHLEPGKGSYVFRGDWGVLDQIIISAGMLDAVGFSWVQLSTHSFNPDYLLEAEGKFSGWPFRTYRGTEYQGGYSDHLPVFCTLRFQAR